MTLLTRDAILKADDLPTKVVPVPEWGGDVMLRTITGYERDAYEAASMKGSGKNKTVNTINLRARLLALCIVDEAGNRIFGDDDVRALGKKSALVVEKLFDVARKLNGFTENDVEELAEGFEPAQSESSTSA